MERAKIYRRKEVIGAPQEIARAPTANSNAKLVRRDLLREVSKLPSTLQNYLNKIVKGNADHDHIDSVQAIGNTMIKILVEEIGKL
jgi:hypothetical protein